MTHHGRAPAASADEADAVVARVAVAVSARLPQITGGMRETLGDAIAELVGDERMLEDLGGAIEGNVVTVLEMLRRHSPLHEVRVPVAAATHARRLAQQGVPVFAMVRAYRLGQAYLLEECFAELAVVCPDPAVSLVAYNAINVRIMSYIDWVSQQVVTAYETERDQWVRNRDTVRTARVRELLAGRDDVDTRDAEAALRYRLRRHHVAAILWTEEGATPGGLGRLEAAVDLLARLLGGDGDPLGVATDGRTTWAWFPCGPDGPDPDVDRIRTALRTAEVGDVRLALGGAEAGVAGFRESHRQAAEACVLVRPCPQRRAVGYREPGVPAATLLARDLERGSALVHAALGPLAADDDVHARLRETLLCFLECGSSYTAAARRLALHKNSVKYRVERALALRGRPLGDDRIDVELALVACRWLGAGRLDARGALPAAERRE